MSGFYLDEYEVTIRRFRPFVSAVRNQGYRPPPGAGKHGHLNAGEGLSIGSGAYEPGWLASDSMRIDVSDAALHCDDAATWTSVSGASEERPINCVNWYDAYAFCIWDGGFLPSEAEWEYAAAGGDLENEYPWGEQMPGTACPGSGCAYAIYNCEYPAGLMVCNLGVGNVAPVGSAPRGAGRWGQMDLAGNLFEWTLDSYSTPYTNPCVDCADMSRPLSRALRGGAYNVAEDNLSPPVARVEFATTMRERDVGFRCARSP